MLSCSPWAPPSASADLTTQAGGPRARPAARCGILCFFLATHEGLLAITAVIYSLYPAGTIVLAKVLSAEGLTAVRIGGLCLAGVSVGLIAASGVG